MSGRSSPHAFIVLIILLAVIIFIEVCALFCVIIDNALRPLDSIRAEIPVRLRSRDTWPNLMLIDRYRMKSITKQAIVR